MRQKGLLLFIAALWMYTASAQTFQLAPPIIKMPANARGFFTDSTELKVIFDMPGAVVRYTLDGSVPTEKSPVCRGTIRLKQSAVVTAITMHPDFTTSDPVRTEVVRVPNKHIPLSAGLTSQQSPKYPALSSKSLTDGQRGDPNNLSKDWLGFEGKPCIAEFNYPKPVNPDTLMVSALTNTGAWIFPPSRIEIWVWSEQEKTFHIVTSKDITGLDANSSTAATSQILYLKNKQLKSKRWRVVVLPYGPIPEWHQGKGSPAWLFVDEIRMF